MSGLRSGPQIHKQDNGTCVCSVHASSRVANSKSIFTVYGHSRRFGAADSLQILTSWSL